MVLIANMGRLQGGLDLFGGTSPDDGRLDVVIVGPRRPAEWIRLAASVILRQQSIPRQLETHQASTVDIVARSPHPREVDGDLIEPAATMSVSIRPQTVWVCVP
jgi:diacylglycerol kinase family enzyme